MEDNKNIKVYLNTLRQKGYLAYEYNPFHNYQTNEDLYIIDSKFLVPKDQAVNLKNGELLTKKTINNGESKWVDKRGRVIDKDFSTWDGNGELIDNPDYNPEDESSPKKIPISHTYELYAKAGSLIDLETDKLNFDLDHPVDITVQPSYDGSVNLILNDNKNIPRLINSRFSVRAKNTYEIVDRIGENDTNIYNSETFDKDTSLYFQYEDNPTISYEGFVKGILPVGQYCFYFTYCDSDENESDYIAESGLIPVFIGSDRSPVSMDGGIKNQSTSKGIKLKLTNIDKSYNYLKVYYVRYFADYQQNRIYECKKIYKKYPINSSTLYLQITGNEQAEDIDANILNISRFNAKSVLTQAQCKNILFFGNIVKNTDNYRELQDCALRIIPSIDAKILNNVSNDYNSSNNYDFGYYDSSNIYNNVGYQDKEYYRFGVVYIYNNGTLSNVYNTLGITLPKDDNATYINDSLFNEVTTEGILKRQYIEIDDYGWIKNSNKFFNNAVQPNAKGVCKLDYGVSDDQTILGIKFEIPEEVIQYLKEDLGIRGLFFVRQKCVPNILAQCYLMPMDETLEAPIIQYDEDKYRTECFLSQSKYSTNSLIEKLRRKESGGTGGLVVNNYSDRLYEYKRVGKSNTSISKHAYAAICPDFLLNQPYYNQIFNGSKFRLEQITDRLKLENLNTEKRHYREAESEKEDESKKQPKYTTGKVFNNIIINSVTDDVPTVAIKDKIYRLEIGETEESFRFGFAEMDTQEYNAGDEDSIEKAKKSYNLVRGKYSPYLAIYSDSQLVTGALYNIYVNEYQNTKQEFQNRMDSSEPFYAISDRFNFNNIELKDSNSRVLTCWRGDCYVNTFTYRLNRNFNDPSLPNNDEIIDNNTWINNYDITDQSKWANISRSDINAVQMGSWITFKLRSSMNYALRSQDHSYVAEEALMGSPRSFYPRSRLMYRGENKMPDSYLYNDAYRASLGFKCYFTLQDINYIKNTFSNRIQYSDISIQDSFKNNYRVSLSTYFRDYSQEYGSIIKLVGFEGYLLVVFEHAIAIAVINERILAGEGDGEPVFINTHNVLPEELTIISDTYGTQWGDSVVKSEAGYVYGVDTIAKKIWRVKGQQLEILSDFKVNKFLVDNISFSERELYPIIGLKNIKTHYNNNKKDIMFTFYDDVYKDEEKVWSLCYNELLGEFITFYSWVPSFSENIDTQFFTFDRNTAKGLALLEKCNYSIPENTGILVDNPVIELPNTKDIPLATLHYTVPKAVTMKITKGGEVSYNQVTEFERGITFNFEKDHWGNYKLFEFNGNNLKISNNKEISDIKTAFDDKKILYLEVTPVLSEPKNVLDDIVKNTLFKTETIALTLKEFVNNPNLTHEDVEKPFLTTDFYIHGTGGIFDIRKNIYPCYWYEKPHPFEFEFIVNDNIAYQKIFNNLILISNKTEPESFHFEIEGDNYEFSTDKRTMYFRQESTKNLYQNLGSDMLYDRNYTDCISKEYTKQQYYRTGNEYLNKKYGLVRQVKSTIFPLYYERVKTYNNIYNDYIPMKNPNLYDFQYLSGSEIKWNRDLNQFNIITHIKNSPVDQVGILRGNSRYKEGKWDIQIPSIVFTQKNETEKDWITITVDEKEYEIPPIVINSSNIPKDLPDDRISKSKLPSIYQNENYNWPRSIENKDWTYRKEAKIRDKWIKIRVRYSGENLAVIHSLVTLYNISYS